MTKIGIPKEIHPGEKRVAATPQTILKLKKLGFDVAVQAGAGEAINASDAEYREAGASIISDAAEADDEQEDQRLRWGVIVQRRLGDR